jgi:hypothetical protein
MCTPPRVRGQGWGDETLVGTHADRYLAPRHSNPGTAMRRSNPRAPQAQVTLRAHRPAPARIELSYRPLPGRLLRTALALLLFWGAIPLLVWVPPHYPWVIGSFCVGLFLAYRAWTGRYRVYSFAGICPRCGHAVSLGIDHEISLPHTLTCYHCHFEPRLEVRFEGEAAGAGPLEHQGGSCTGLWEVRWLADEPFVVCDRCLAGAPATPETHRAAEAENQRARTLTQLTREGRPMI